MKKTRISKAKPTKVLLKIAKIGRGTKLYIDGKKVNNCREVIIRAAGGQISTVTLKLVNVEAVVKGEAEVHSYQDVDVSRCDSQEDYRYDEHD